MTKTIIPQLSVQDTERSDAIFYGVILKSKLFQEHIKFSGDRKVNNRKNGKHRITYAVEGNNWNLLDVSIFPVNKQIRYYLRKEGSIDDNGRLNSNDSFIEEIISGCQGKVTTRRVNGVLCSYDDALYVANVISGLMDDKSGKYYAKNKQHLIEYGTDKDTESDITEIISSNDNPTDKQRLITARLGQGDYRKGLLEIWGKCSVTSCATKELLIASHIKPWRVSDNQERLDPFNGLLLIATVDKAFDSGLISFNDDGSILISPLFNEYELTGISLDMKIEPREQNLPYLAYHRENVFRR